MSNYHSMLDVICVLGYDNIINILEFFLLLWTSMVSFVRDQIGDPIQGQLYLRQIITKPLGIYTPFS